MHFIFIASKHDSVAIVWHITTFILFLLFEEKKLQPEIITLRKGKNKEMIKCT